jgi:hypothetical protein
MRQGFAVVRIRELRISSDCSVEVLNSLLYLSPRLKACSQTVQGPRVVGADFQSFTKEFFASLLVGLLPDIKVTQDYPCPGVLWVKAQDLD